MSDRTLIAQATADIGVTPYAVAIAAGPHRLIAAEPQAIGGQDAGPAPFALLLALGVCTASTVRMYADRKPWPLAAMQGELCDITQDAAAAIACQLTLGAPLAPEQCAPCRHRRTHPDPGAHGGRAHPNHTRLLRLLK